MPLAPRYIISIPAIKSVIVRIITSKTKPNLMGLAIIARAMIILKAPTPIVAAL